MIADPLTVNPPAAAPAAHGVDLRPLARASRWQPAEFVFWLLPVAGWFAFPENLEHPAFGLALGRALELEGHCHLDALV